jgi:hypothetical protein
MNKFVEASTKDRVSITTDDDLTIIASGRLWMIMHNIAEAVIDCCFDEAEEGDIEEITRLIRENAYKIATAILEQRFVK